MRGLVTLLIAALVASGCSDGGERSARAPSPSSSSPAPSPAALVEDDVRLYQHPDGYVRFASPSRNILCDLGSESDADFLTCFVREHTWKGPACPAGEGAGFGIGDTDDELGHLSCATAPRGSAGYRELAYGHSVSGINIVCASAPEGLTCESERAPHGRFFVSRARYSLR